MFVRGGIAGGRCGAARRHHVVSQHFFAAGERDGPKFASSERIDREIDFDRAPRDAESSERRIDAEQGL